MSCKIHVCIVFRPKSASESSQGPTPGSVASNYSEGGSMFIRDNTNNKENKVHTEDRSIIIKSKNNSFPYCSLESAPVPVLMLIISRRLAPQESHQHTIEDRGFVLTQLVSVSIDHA